MLNLSLYLRSIGLLGTLGLVGIGACSSESLKPADGGGNDHPAVSDPAACGCSVVNYTLTMSWACFCQKYNCTQSKPACSAQGQWTNGCGLQEWSVFTIGGIERWVYDATGALVGEQLGTDDGEFTCPTDPTMIGFSLRAGQFPDACDSATTCACGPDGGACEPTDAGLTLQ